MGEPGAVGRVARRRGHRGGAGGWRARTGGAHSGATGCALAASGLGAAGWKQRRPWAAGFAFAAAREAFAAGTSVRAAPSRLTFATQGDSNLDLTASAGPAAPW